MSRIAVIGCGLLGTKIIGCLIYHGHEVVVYDNDSSASYAFPKKLEADIKELFQDGLLRTTHTRGSYSVAKTLKEAVIRVDFIIEAIKEDENVKKAFYQRLAQYCESDTIITSNTLTLNLEDIFDCLPYKERTLGLRFLFPVYFIEDVEITRTKYTSNESFEKVKRLIESLDKSLFVRKADGVPLVLNREEREMRKKARREFLRRTNSDYFHLSSTLSDHRGYFSQAIPVSQSVPPSSAPPETFRVGHGGPDHSPCAPTNTHNFHMLPSSAPPETFKVGHAGPNSTPPATTIKCNVNMPPSSAPPETFKVGHGGSYLDPPETFQVGHAGHHSTQDVPNKEGAAPTSATNGASSTQFAPFGGEYNSGHFGDGTSRRINQLSLGCSSFELPFANQIICQKCSFRETNCLLVPCHHYSCTECAKSLMNQRKECPAPDCSKMVENYVRVGSP